MIKNKILSIVFVINIAVISGLFAEELPNLIFTPIVQEGEYISKGSVSIYNETLRGYLINDSRITLTDDLGSSKDGKPLTLKNAISLGQNKKADFVLYGKLSKSSSEIHIYITLLDPVSEINILSNHTITNDDMINSDLEILSEKIVQQISISSQDSIEYLKAYYESENWEKAWLIYREISRNSKSPDPEIKKYAGVIKENLSMKFFRDAELLLKSESFDDARALIFRAIELKPGTVDYESLKIKIEEDFNTYREEKKSIVLKTIQELIGSELYRSADVILVKLEESGFSQDADVVVIRNKVKQGLKEISFFDASRKAFKNQKYIEARLQLNNAMTINPFKAEYIEFQMRINEREAQEIKNQRTWDKYSSELAMLDPFLLFVQAKKAEWFLTVSHSYNTFVYKAVEPVLEEKFIGMEGTEFSFLKFLPPFLDILVLDSDVFELKPTVFSDISFTTCVEKSSILETGVKSVEHSAFYIGGTAGLSLTAFAYTLGSGITLQTGTFVKTDKEIFPYDEKSNTSSSLWDYTLGIGMDLWLSWYPFDDIQVILRYRDISTGLWGENTVYTDTFFRIFSIGIGTRLF